MRLFKNTLLFLVINFGALALGSWLMNNGPMTTWYQNLNQAPWTPPGWMFGVAWSMIMFCFSIYMAYLFMSSPSTKVKILFVLQFILNISWNYIFFNLHLVAFGFIILLGLTSLIAFFLWNFKTTLKLKSLFILPYFIWLCIACSLNLYILLYN